MAIVIGAGLGLRQSVVAGLTMDRVDFLRAPCGSTASGSNPREPGPGRLHESAKVTLDVYGHLWPGDEDRFRDAIDRLGTAAAKDLRRTTA